MANEARRGRRTLRWLADNLRPLLELDEELGELVEVSDLKAKIDAELAAAKAELETVRANTASDAERGQREREAADRACKEAIAARKAGAEKEASDIIAAAQERAATLAAEAEQSRQAVLADREKASAELSALNESLNAARQELETVIGEVRAKRAEHDRVTAQHQEFLRGIGAR